MIALAPQSETIQPVSDARVLEMFAAGKTYQEIADELGRSRGFVYEIALRLGARKSEARIRERTRERKANMLADLKEIIGTTLKADVLEYLSLLPDNSVNLFVTSPPYNIGRGYGEHSSSDSMRHVYFHGWLMQVVSEMARAVKEGGTVVLQVGTTRDEHGDMLPLDILLDADLRRAGLTYRNRVMWPAHAGLTPKRRLAERYETALIFSKGETQTFNPNAARIPQKNPGKRAFRGPNKGQLSGNPLGAWPTDIWNITRIGHNNAEKSGHPAQFPIDFPKRAILLYTMPGDLICDPFSGSGSTQIACVRTGRAFTGCDLFYEEIRSKRLDGEKLDDVCALPGVTPQSSALWTAEAQRRDVPATPITAARDAEMLLELFEEEHRDE